MFNSKWNARHLTDSIQQILGLIPRRAADRGLHIVDHTSIVMIALWSVLQREPKIGRVALERAGADPFDLARDLNRLLQEKAAEHPVAVTSDGVRVLVKTREAYTPWDFDVVLEPLLRQAEHELLEFGHNYVGSEHLVLAILRLADPTLSCLLHQHGLSHSHVRETVAKLLSHEDE